MQHKVIEQPTVATRYTLLWRSSPNLNTWHPVNPIRREFYPTEELETALLEHGPKNVRVETIFVELGEN